MESRPYDIFYDHTYTDSTPINHQNNIIKDGARKNQYKLLPKWDKMFTDSRYYQAIEYKIDNSHRLPAHLSTDWQYYKAEAHRVLLSHLPQRSGQYSNVGENLVMQHYLKSIQFQNIFRPLTPEEVCEEKQRSKKSKRISPDARAELKNFWQKIVCNMKSDQVNMIDANTQTDYRDSDTQTLPYSPPYINKKEKNLFSNKSELVSLATMTYGNGLPAGLDEMLVLIRRKEEEKFLRSSKYASMSWEKKLKALESYNRCTWAARQKQIERIQAVQLELYVEVIKKREKMKECRIQSIVKEKWCKKINADGELTKKFQKIKNDCVKNIRFSENQHKSKVLNSRWTHDIIDTRLDKGSTTFAPLLMQGKAKRLNYENVNSKYLSSYKGILEFEKTLSFEPNIKLPYIEDRREDGYIPNKYKYKHILVECQQMCEEQKIKSRTERYKLSLLVVKKAIPKIGQLTPTLPKICDSVLKLNDAVLLLQCCLRGRIVQRDAFEGSDFAQSLIQELRSINKLRDPDWGRMMEERSTLAKQKRMEALFGENKFKSIFSEMDGSSISDLLYFLSGELVRLKEERRLHALSMLVERMRRMREAEEAGSRLMEIERRKVTDEMFRQLVEVNNELVDDYFMDIVTETVDESATIQARLQIEQTAAIINEQAYNDDRFLMKVDSLADKIITEMVNSFLLPEVERRAFKKRVSDVQHELLYAAHNEIYNTIDMIISEEDSDSDYTM